MKRLLLPSKFSRYHWFYLIFTITVFCVLCTSGFAEESANIPVIEKHYITSGPYSGCENPSPEPKNSFLTGEGVTAYNFITNAKTSDTSYMVWHAPDDSSFRIDNPISFDGSACFYTGGNPSNTQIPGKWSVDFYYNDVKMYTDEFVMLESTSVLTIEKHYITSGPYSGCENPSPEPKNSFLTGEGVTAYNFITNAKTSDTSYMVWHAPDDSSFRIDNPISFDGSACFYTGGNPSNTQMPGKWSVDFYYNDVKMYTDEFVMLEQNCSVEITSPASGATFVVHEIIDFSCSATAADGEITSYQWDFGDGDSFSTHQNPSFPYGEEGTYTVTLIVTDNDGATASDTIEVEISSTATILTISPTSRSVAAGAGSTTFSVSNSGGGDMNWSAAKGDSWLTISSGSSGTNAGIVTVEYDANNDQTNPNGTSRTGTISVSAPDAENSPQVLLVTQSRDTSIAGILHHFEFSTISAPQQINDSFFITVTAKDAYNNRVTDFDDRVSLFSNLGRVNPTALFFTSGTATANVVLYEVGHSILRCDGSVCHGQSNSFEVLGVSQCLSDVTGELVDIYGDPVAGARVQALEVLDYSVAVEVLSDSDGKYTFSNLPCGRYQLRGIATGVDGNRVVADFCRIRVDGQPLPLSTFTMKIKARTYGTPVILVPGIMGSSSTNQAAFPGLSREKPDRNLHIHLKNSLVLWIHDPLGWGSLEDSLKDDFLTFDCPWDWRLGADEAALEYLIPKINEALLRSATGKVHIVAHSLGGLLARSLIQSDILYAEGEKYYEKIDKLVMIGTPHLGSCNPYYIWEGGDPLGLDNLVKNGFWTNNFYSETIKKLWKTYDSNEKWDNSNHCAIIDFLVERVSGGYDKPSSLRQLMHTGNFLTLKADSDNKDNWWGVTKEGNINNWLINLNKCDNVDRMTANMEDGSKIRTKLFVGNGKKTLRAIHTWKGVCLGCPDGCRYLDGAPVAPVKDEDNANLVPDGGDGTVPYNSATWPATKEAGNWAVLEGVNSDSKHAELPGKFNNQIRTFLTGISKPATTSLRTSESVTSTLTFTIDNSQRFIISDPSGNQTGIDPDTGTVVEEIAGAYMLFDGRQGVVSLPDPVDGTYILTYFGGPERDFDLTVDLDHFADEELDLLEKSGFSPDSPVTVEVVVDSLSDPAISLNPPIAGCDCLTSQPYDDSGQLYTQLQWDDNPDAVAYRVYTVADTEPYYHELAEIGKTAYPKYDTGELWRDSEDEPLRVYAVTFLDADGNESFFSNKVYNDDRDGDNLTDLEEIEQGTLVDNPDTDGDGLFDGEEVYAGSLPDDPDSDDDGYDDYGEVQGHSDPRFADSIPDLHVNDDGVCNGEHYCYPTIADACQAAQGVGNIKIGQGDYPETLTLDENKLITMTGGWNCDYTSSDSDSVVVGSLTISSGCLIVEKVIIAGQ